MNRIAAISAGGVLAILAGCPASDGIVFNGVRQVEQFPIRKTPINHLELEGETETSPGSGVYFMDVQKLPVDPLGFSVLPFPGHDWWAMDMLSPGGGFANPAICSDNPTCRTLGQIPDWWFTCDIWKAPGPGWPNPNVTTDATNPANKFIAAWVLSIQNQWFLRAPNGAAVAPPGPGEAPWTIESGSFSSLHISLHETGVTTVPDDYTPSLTGNPPIGPQQEVGDPLTIGANNVRRIVVPVNNVVSYGFDGNGAPAGLLAAAWRESPGENVKIETNLSAFPTTNTFMQSVGVPVPDYFGGGGPITCGGGVYHGRFSTQWTDTTAGTSSTISQNDGVIYSYYLATVGNHLIGYGLGLMDSAFALPGVISNQEDIMNISVILDMTAFIAAGKQFQFVLEDILRMQDSVNGTFQDPGPKSTLPGKDRES